MWVQEGERADEAALARSLDGLETRILPTLLQQFGGGKIREERLRVAIVNVRVGGLVGYYSSVNEYPRAGAPFSNERSLVVMSLQSVQPGTGGYESGLAHELQHLVQGRPEPAPGGRPGGTACSSTGWSRTGRTRGRPRRVGGATATSRSCGSTRSGSRRCRRGSPRRSPSTGRATTPYRRRPQAPRSPCRRIPR